MVSFTQNDFKIMLVMTLFLVIISFLFPPMGFTSQSVNATDIPDFNTSQNQFDYLNDELEKPGNPSEGTLRYVEGAKEFEDNRVVWLNDDTVSISLFNDGTVQDPQPRIGLAKFNTSTYETSKYINESEFKSIENYSYVVTFENVVITDNNETITVDWHVIEQPENQGLIESIPIIGGLYSSGAALAATLGWFVSIVFVMITNAVLAVTNVFITLFNIMAFTFGFMYWLLGTYASVVTSAPTGYVGVFMAIPGVILSFEFAKITILLVRTILDGIPLT